MLKIRGPHFETHCSTESLMIKTHTEYVLITRCFTGYWGPKGVPRLQKFASLKYVLSFPREMSGNK